MENESPKTNRNPTVIGIIAIAVLVLVVGAVAIIGNKNKSTDDAASTSSQKTETSDKAAADTSDDASTDTTPTAGYKSGTYEADGSYTSPGGTEEVHVTVTLDGDTITNAEVTTDPASPTSKEYQGEFKRGFKSLVVGKDIDDVKLSKVSGSSLTSQGFNAAIAQIKQQAQSA